MFENNSQITIDTNTAVSDYGFTMKGYTTQDVVKMLRARQGKRTQLEFAREVGVKQQHISEIFLGTRGPGKKILDYLGLENGFIKSERAA